MFDHVTEVKVATISMWNAAAMLIHVFAFTLLYMKGNKNHTLKTFFIAQLGMFIWLAGKVLKTVSPNELLRWGFIVFYYFGICLLEAGFLDFAVTYFTGKPMKKGLRIPLYTLALLQFIFVLTNPLHYTFYSRFGFWGDDFGRYFYVHVAINYGLILLGMVLCGIKFSKQMRSAKLWQRFMIPFAILTPLIFNFIYISRLLEALFDYLGIQVFDITPIVYTWSILVFVYATFKHEFLDLTPIMKHEITGHLDTLILIVDEQGNAIYTNREFDRAFDNEGNSDTAKALIQRYNLKGNSLIDDGYISYNGYHYKYVISPLKSVNQLQHIVSFEDITEYEMARIALDKENQQLHESNRKLESQIEMLVETSAIGARNYVARELHDIIGHSLVVSMKLLEVSTIAYEKNKAHVKDSIAKAGETLEHGFEEMATLLDKGVHHKVQIDGLDKELKSLLKAVEVSGLDVKYYFKCKEMTVTDKVFDVVRKVSMELTTNALKHSKADRLLLSLMTVDDEIRLTVMDNGIGTKTLTKGNGLMGIDSRLALIGGVANYDTDNSEGFIVNVSVPLYT